MVLKDMYKGLVNSPETILTEELSDIGTTIMVEDVAAIPAAPNLLTIGGDTENPETVKVISISGSVVTIERGFQGVARSWSIETRVSRNFTEYDHNTFIENIKTLKTSLRSLEYSELSSTATNIDSEGIYTDTEWKRNDNTLYAKSTLLGTYPYSQIKIDYYNDEGTAIIKTITWNLTYDDNEFPYAREVI